MGIYLVKVAFVYRAISYLLKLNIVYDNGVSLQIIVVYMKFPNSKKRDPCGCWLGQIIGHFSPILNQQKLYRHALFKNFASRVHNTIISRQMKCNSTKWNFQIYFCNLRGLYYTPNLLKFF